MPDSRYNVPDNWEPVYGGGIRYAADFPGEKSGVIPGIIGWKTPDGFISPDKLPEEYKVDEPGQVLPNLKKLVDKYKPEFTEREISGQKGPETPENLPSGKDGPSIEDQIKHLQVENFTLKQIAVDLHWMARRYADGRCTYAPGIVNQAVRQLRAMGVELNLGGERTPWARDGMGPGYSGLSEEEYNQGEPVGGWNGIARDEETQALSARVESLQGEVERLQRVESWCRWWFQLPDKCWSGFHMRAFMRLKDALRAIAPLKEMDENEIGPKSKELDDRDKALKDIKEESHEETCDKVIYGASSTCDCDAIQALHQDIKEDEVKR